MVGRFFGWHDFLYLLMGAEWTLILSATAFLGGGLLGLAVALGHISRLGLIRISAIAFVQAVQGIPLLVLLFISYFGITFVGGNVSPMTAAAIALTVYSAAFLADIWRGAIQAVPRSQWLGGESLGLSSTQQLIHIIVPQAIPIALPPTVGFLVQIVKNTSLASLIGFIELARAGQLIHNATFQPARVFGCVAVLYFVICFPLSMASRRLERKYHVGRASLRRS
jgi:polar amino acid transport system permease protein